MNWEGDEVVRTESEVDRRVNAREKQPRNTPSKDRVMKGFRKPHRGGFAAGAKKAGRATGYYYGNELFFFVKGALHFQRLFKRVQLLLTAMLIKLLLCSLLLLS